MIIVDSSVWIDYFNGRQTPQTDKLDDLLGVVLLGIGDLILTEVLQGFRDDKDYCKAKAVLTSLNVLNMLDTDLAIRSADNFRNLRKQGITVRKTNDVIIATYVIEHGHHLLFADKDFIPFVNLLGMNGIKC